MRKANLVYILVLDFLLREETFKHGSFNGDVTTTQTFHLSSENGHP